MRDAAPRREGSCYACRLDALGLDLWRTGDCAGPVFVCLACLTDPAPLARDTFVEGQLVVRTRLAEAMGIAWSSARGRVFGFSRDGRLLWVRRDGIKHPERYSPRFWIPA